MKRMKAEININYKRPNYLIIIAVFLIAILTFNLVWQIIKESIIANIPGDEIAELYDFKSDGTITEKSTGFVFENDKKPIEISYHNVSANVNTETNKLLSYSPKEDFIVEFDENVFSGIILDTVKKDGKQLIEKSYYSGDMKVDELTFENFSIEYGYDELDRLNSQSLEDSEIEIEYINSNNVKVKSNSAKTGVKSKVAADAKTEQSNLPYKIYIDDLLAYEYKYNNFSQIIYEADYINEVAFGYEYYGDDLITKKYYNIFNGIAFNYKTEDITANFTALDNGFKHYDSVYAYNDSKLNSILKNDKAFNVNYNYTYKDRQYITSLQEGNNTTYYSYINDKLVMEESDTSAIEYIIDGEMKYSGIIYNGDTYFYGYDALGRISSILDYNGNIVVEYYYNALGELYEVSGALKDSLGKSNSILFNDSLIYSHDLALYFSADAVYNPYSSRKVSANEISIKGEPNTLKSNDDSFTKNPVNKNTVIHDRVLQIVKDYFNYSKIDANAAIYLENDSEETIGVVDIFTLPYEISPFNMGNAVNGNQVYDIVYNSPNSIEYAKAKLKSIIDPQSQVYVSFVSQFKPIIGSMEISGQFVFLGDLISYSTIENGIVAYDVLENKTSNYKLGTNVYNYDISKYIVFNKPDFDLDMFSGTTVIPGLSQEKFEQIDKELKVVQAESVSVEERLLEYNDPSQFIDNDVDDFWRDVDVPEGKTLTFDAYGNSTVTDMPQNDSTWKVIAKSITGIVIAVVVSVVVVATAGCAGVVMGVLVGALVGASVGFVIGSVAGATVELIDQISQGEQINWSDIAKESHDWGMDGLKQGAVQGAFSGFSAGLTSACFEVGTPIATSNGQTEIQNIKMGDSVLSYNEQTNKVENKKVVRTFEETSALKTTVTVNGEDIVTTPAHKFYSNERGYIDAKYLRAGDILVSVNGEKKVVEKVQHEILEEPITVYNFEVEGNQNYFAGGSSVLVHNAGACSKLLSLIGKDLSTANKVGEYVGKSFVELMPYMAGAINIRFSSMVDSLGKAGVKDTEGNPLGGNNNGDKKQKTHDHHIVAQNAYKAEIARSILIKFDIKIDDKKNIAKLSAKKHSHLHTNNYYNSINIRIVLAVNFDDLEELVTSMLVKKDYVKNLQTVLEKLTEKIDNLSDDEKKDKLKTLEATLAQLKTKLQADHTIF